MPYHPVQLFDDADAPWLATLVDTAEASIGQPWRVLLDRLEALPLVTSASRTARAIASLRRVVGARPRVTPTARVVRELVLGHPVLDAEARAERLAAAAARLGLTADALEARLWSDLARERAVVMAERPSVRRIAAAANAEQLARALARARHVRLRVWGDPRELVRIAAARGLLATASPDASDSTTLDITGPLALFHATTVYGRALGLLVPWLAGLERFELEIRCDLGRGEGILRVAPPLLLPPAPAPRPRDHAPDVRLARDLAAAGCDVTRDPPPIIAGDRLLFPDLCVDGWWLEVIHFATAEYLADRFARYRMAGITRVVVCLRSPAVDGSELPPRVLPFQRAIDAGKLRELISRSSRSPDG
jgi:predicted nuclease of restriction endonuclease-like RecB superfamily